LQKQDNNSTMESCFKFQAPRLKFRGKTNQKFLGFNILLSLKK
jgi:hypothetical protein